MLVQEKTRTLLINNYPSTSESRIRILSDIRRAVVEGQLVLKISEEELTLIVDEAVTNAMEHGNHWESGKRVFLAVWIEDNELHVTIEDQGSGFDYRNHRSDFVRGNRMSQRGRGISLIRRFCVPSWTKSGRLVDLKIPLFV